MATKPTKSVPMCCVRIGCESLLMPVSKGTQLLSLLQEAVDCKERYLDGSGHVYVIGDQPKVELATVKPNQVRRPPTPGQNGDPLALENNPSAHFNF